MLANAAQLSSYSDKFSIVYLDILDRLIYTYNYYDIIKVNHTDDRKIDKTFYINNIRGCDDLLKFEVIRIRSFLLQIFCNNNVE